MSGSGTGEVLDELIKHISHEASEEDSSLPKIAIVGQPNVGKSSLLNALMGQERTIVSDIAGTTRDVIEETLNIGGIVFRLIDTAGIREGAEEIEAMGIERSKEKIQQAKVVLCLADATSIESIQEVGQWVKQLKNDFPTKKIGMIVNKMDISHNHQLENSISISAKAGQNIDKIKPSDCRKFAEKFSLENVAPMYEKYFQDVLNVYTGNGWYAM
jgi:tRNA modification GTPase